MPWWLGYLHYIFLYHLIAPQTWNPYSLKYQTSSHSQIRNTQVETWISGHHLQVKYQRKKTVRHNQQTQQPQPPQHFCRRCRMFDSWLYYCTISKFSVYEFALYTHIWNNGVRHYSLYTHPYWTEVKYMPVCGLVMCVNWCTVKLAHRSFSTTVSQ